MSYEDYRSLNKNNYSFEIESKKQQGKVVAIYPSDITNVVQMKVEFRGSSKFGTDLRTGNTFSIKRGNRSAVTDALIIYAGEDLEEV